MRPGYQEGLPKRQEICFHDLSSVKYHTSSRAAHNRIQESINFMCGAVRNAMGG